MNRRPSPFEHRGGWEMRRMRAPQPTRVTILDSASSRARVTAEALRRIDITSYPIPTGLVIAARGDEVLVTLILFTTDREGGQEITISAPLILTGGELRPGAAEWMTLNHIQDVMLHEIREHMRVAGKLVRDPHVNEPKP